MKDSKPVLLFDGVCNFCNGAVQFIIRRDPEGRLQFAAMQSSIGQRLLQEHGLESLSLRTMVLVDGTQHYVKSDAALRIAPLMRAPWPLLSAFRFVPRLIRDWVYDRIAANRYRWFGQRDQCIVPAEEIRSRFLE